VTVAGEPGGRYQDVLPTVEVARSGAPVGSASKPCARSAGRRARGVPHPTAGGDPACAAAATCWRAKCRDVAISTIYKGTRGPEPCRPGRGILWGVFGDRSSGRCLELTDIGDCRGSSGGVRTAEALRSASIGPQTEPLTGLVSDPVWIG
jgi:hypothetical protein